MGNNYCFKHLHESVVLMALTYLKEIFSKQ